VASQRGGGVPFEETHTGRMFDKTVRHAIRIERYKAGLYARLSPTIEGMFSEVAAEVRKRLPYLVKLPRSALREKKHRNQLDLLILRKRAISTAKLGETLIQLTDELKELALLEAEWSVRALRSAIPIEVSLTKPSERMLVAAFEQKPIHGQLLKEWFGPSGLGHVDAAMSGAIRRGLADGLGVEQITRSIIGKNRSVAKTFRNNVRGTTRTLISGVSNQAREDTWAKNDDIVEKVQFVATLDRRTTDICAGLDSKIYKINEGPRPPMHMQCRSTTTPVLKSWRSMGIDLTELPPTTRAQMPGSRGLATEKTTYGQWLKRQNKTVQEDVLGKGRAKLFRSGDVQIDEFVDYSKANPRSYTLTELRSNAGLTGK
jgi:SPP1 gp7 family putative phage head morphogenesis protein